MCKAFSCIATRNKKVYWKLGIDGHNELVEKFKLDDKTKGYPFQCVVDLWKQGLVPSFDGKNWRLHSGKKAKIVFKISQKELRKLRCKK